MRAGPWALLAAALALTACAPAAPSTAVPGPTAGAAAPSDARAAAPPAAAPATEPGAVAGAVVPVPLDPPRVVRIANSGLAAQAPTFLAIEEGYFAELGLAPEVINLPGTADSIALLSGGQIDVATAAISAAFFNAVARGVAIRMVADHGTYIPGRTTAGLVVRADLVEQQPWRGYQDLKGMKVAVQQPGSLLEYDLELMLRRGGLQRDDIEVVVLSFADIATAFVNHAIDAATYNEPFATQLEQQGVIKKIAYTDDVEPYGIITGLMFGEPFANDTAAARNFMVAYLRGVRRYWDAYDGRADFQTGDRRAAEVHAAQGCRADPEDPAHGPEPGRLPRRVPPRPLPGLVRRARAGDAESRPLARVRPELRGLRQRRPRALRARRPAAPPGVTGPSGASG